MATCSTGDFAWLIPRNHVAQRLFSRTYAYVEKNDEFHLRFMNSTGSEPLPAADEPVESSTEYDTHLDTDTDSYSAKALQHLGYFVLSLEEKRRPEILAWDGESVEGPANPLPTVTSTYYWQSQEITWLNPWLAFI